MTDKLTSSNLYILDSNILLETPVIINNSFIIEFSKKVTKLLRHPGFEPGSTAWKAAILTTRLITHDLLL